jgi:hypothetical protein
MIAYWQFLSVGIWLLLKGSLIQWKDANWKFSRKMLTESSVERY